MKKQRTIAYIDGFNLYYCAVKNTGYKWLNLENLCKNLLDLNKHEICGIKYFTARISARLEDPNAPTRQDVYWRALKSLCSDIEIIEGFFLSSEKFSFLAPCAGKGFVKTVKTEEKGSDVNLSVHMLNDAWEDKYDCAFLISNDSDMYESARLIKERCKKRIGWGVYACKDNFHISQKLSGIVDFKKKITSEILSNSLMPDTIPGTTITKPKMW